MNYNLNNPMDWETFKSMPVDLQAEYLNSLHTRFNVGVATICKDVFSIKPAMLRQHMKRHGLEMPKGKRLNVLEQAVWWLWLHGRTVPQ